MLYYNSFSEKEVDFIQKDKFPAVLQRKLTLLVIVGPACFIFGLAYHLSINDKTLLYISIAVLITCLFKSILLYQTIAQKKYLEIVEVCVKVTFNPISRYRKIRLLDENLIETEFVLRKDMKITIGYKYLFYMKNIENGYLPNIKALGIDNLIGYESLGEA